MTNSAAPRRLAAVIDPRRNALRLTIEHLPLRASFAWRVPPCERRKALAKARPPMIARSRRHNMGHDDPIPDALLERVDARAKTLGISRNRLVLEALARSGSPPSNARGSSTR